MSRNADGTYMLGNPGGPGHLGRKKDQPQLQEHLRTTLLGALKEVCDDPLVMQSVAAGLKHFALTEPVNFAAWMNQVMGQHLKIEQTVERRVVLTFEKAEPPPDWVPNRLDIIEDEEGDAA